MIVYAKGQVRGLTTGIGLWFVGSTGLSCGFGFWQIGLVATGFGLAALWLLRLVDQKPPVPSPNPA